MHHSVPSTQYHSTSTNQYYPAPITTQYCPVLSPLLCPHPTALSTLSVHLSVCVGMCERCCGHCLLHLHQQSLFIIPIPSSLYTDAMLMPHTVCIEHGAAAMRRFVSLTLEIFHLWVGQVGRAGGYSGQTCRCLDPATLTSWGSLN